MDAKLEQFSTKMEKTIANLKEEYASIRAGRANPHLLDKLKVDYYGQPSSFQSVANVSVPEPRVIQIQPWESKLIKDIEKAIINSDLGLNPSNDGKVIRLVFPELTEDRRKELVKDIKKKAENAKVAIRNIRRDANEIFKKQNKASEISEDEFKHLEDDVQKITDRHINEIDKIMDDKSKEILTV
jgi:ribosome recycling factor